MTDSKPYNSVVPQLVTKPAVEASAMFGMPCVKIKGKAFAGLWKEALVVKVGKDRVKALLSAKTGLPFNPGMGPMKEWVLIPAPKTGVEKKWLALAEEAQTFVVGRS